MSVTRPAGKEEKMRESEMTAMVEALRQIEAEQYLSLSGLAHKLGISTGYLSMIFSGQRHPGMRFVRAVMEHFPEIRRLIGESLQRPTERDAACPDKSDLDPTEAADAR